MDSRTPLDYALFQLSPRRSRCELVVSGNGRTEKIASGFLKPFVTHLKVAKEQAEQSAQSIVLQVEKPGANGRTWFSKGTLERFVRFVSTPEVLELVNTFEAEMSQLEGARKIYSQGAGDPLSATNGRRGASATVTADTTKNELLRAIDVRLVAVKQDLATACARASSAGFTIDNVSELLLFADHFGAHRLNEACTKFISLCQRRADLTSHQYLQPASSSQWKVFDDGNVRSSSGSEMSLDGPEVNGSHDGLHIQKLHTSQQPVEGTVESATYKQLKPAMQSSREKQVEKAMGSFPPAERPAEPLRQAGGGGSRRLSVQDRINHFESKQQEQASSSGNSDSSVASRTTTGRGEHRRVPSMEKSVLRRWSSSSDMSTDFNGTDSSSFSDKKDNNFAWHLTSAKAEEEVSGLKDTATSRHLSSQKDDPNNSSSRTINTLSSSIMSVTPTSSGIQVDSLIVKDQGVTEAHNLFGRLEHPGPSGQATSGTQSKAFQKPGEAREGNLLEDHKVLPIPFSDDNAAVKNQENLPVPSLSISHKSSRLQPKGISSAAEGPSVKDQHSRMLGKKTENVGGKLNAIPDLGPHLQAPSGSAEVISSGVEVHAAGSQWKNPSRKASEVVGKGTYATGLRFQFFPAKSNGDDSASEGKTWHGQRPHVDHTWNPQGDEGVTYTEGNVVPVFLGKKVDQCVKIDDPPAKASLERVRVIRPSKGVQELNIELQMKANELEKQFAAHKLRIQNDQMISSRRHKSTGGQVDHVPMAVNKLGKESNIKGLEFDADLLLKMVDSQDYSIGVQQKLGIQSLTEELRGRFYEKYVKKREVKLREEWRLKRAQKEASMKAMQDSLERSQAEMRARLSRSADARDLSRYTKTRLGVHAALRNTCQGVESSLGEQELHEQVYPDQDTSYGDNLSGYGSSKSTDSKKYFPTRSSSASVPKPSVISTDSSYGKQRTLSQILRL